jgi:adenylylsulfate kinase-like enzyme
MRNLTAQTEGRVIWITGLAGAGKSSIAREVRALLKESSDRAILLDGDDVRVAVNDPHVGHDRASRLTNALRICRLAKLLADQGFTLIVPTMSLFKEVHAWNRAHLPNYFEVFVKVGLDTLRARDARGLYSRAARGEAEHVVGIHVEYDEPQSPDLVLSNEDSESTLSALSRRIVETVQRREVPL